MGLDKHKVLCWLRLKTGYWRNLTGTQNEALGFWFFVVFSFSSKVMGFQTSHVENGNLYLITGGRMQCSSLAHSGQLCHRPQGCICRAMSILILFQWLHSQCCRVVEPTSWRLQKRCSLLHLQFLQPWGSPVHQPTLLQPRHSPQTN